MKLIQIDKKALLEAMKMRKLGTGTLPNLLGIRSDDLLKVIALEEAEEELAKKLIGMLGKGIVAKLEAEKVREPALNEGKTEDGQPADGGDPFSGTIQELQDRVRDGEIDATELGKVERGREAPRTTLIHWLEENYGA
jgi:hypothetical protein